jgi:hypothetical protein
VHVFLWYQATHPTPLHASPCFFRRYLPGRPNPHELQGTRLRPPHSAHLC